MVVKNLRVIKWLTLLTLLSIMDNPGVNAEDPFCQVGASKAPFNLYDHVKKSYTADIFAVTIEPSGNYNDVFEITSYEMKEHYSKDAQKYSFYDVSTKDMESDVISMGGQQVSGSFGLYDQKLKTIFYSNRKDKACEANPDLTYAFGFQSLRMFREESGSYVGIDKSRAEPLHLWRNCFTKKNGVEVKEEMYVSMKNSQWRNPTGQDYVPVMLVREAKKEGKTSRTNNHVLKFTHRASDSDRLQADFEPPVGTVCPSKPEVALPTLPQSISFSVENNNRYALFTEFVYDFEKKIVSTHKAANELAVDSYQLGVVFQNTARYGNRRTCRMSPYAVLHDTHLNKTVDYMETNNAFSSVSQFLGGSAEEYTFNGKQMIRGIPVYAYTKKDEYYQDDVNVIVTLYISDPSVKISDGVQGSTGVSSRVLVGKEVMKNNYDGYRGSHSKSNYIDMAAPETPRLQFDPTSIMFCENKLGSRSFVLTLVSTSGESDSPVFDQLARQQFKKQLRNAISQITDAIFLRVNIADVRIASGTVIAQGQILGPVGNERRVKKYNYLRVKNYPAQRKHVIKTKRVSYYDRCKTYFNEEQTAPMAAFCDGQCKLYDTILIDKESTEESNSYRCTIYIRSQSEVDDTPLDEVWSRLSESIDRGALKIDSFTAEQLYEPSNQLFPVALNVTQDRQGSKYQKITLPSTQNVVSTTSANSLTACAQQCSYSSGYTCRQFSFCSKSHKCLLHGLEMVNQENITASDAGGSGCNTYERSYLSDFSKIGDTSAVASSSGSIFEQVSDPEDCAMLCLSSEDSRCESFDVCGEPGSVKGATCFLSSKHFVDITNSQPQTIRQDKTCTHWSRDYLGDYTRKQGVTSLRVTSTATGADAAACAQACSAKSNAFEGRCSMFHFCAKGGVCEFIDEKSIPSKNFRKSPDVSVKGGCTTFSLQDDAFRQHGLFLSDRERAESNRVGPYGSGSMAALAVAVLALSIGSVFLGLFISSRYQTGTWGWGWVVAVKKAVGINGTPSGQASFDNPTMNFSKEEYDA